MKSQREFNGYPQPTVGALGRIDTQRPSMLRLKAPGFKGTASGGESTVKKLRAPR